MKKGTGAAKPKTSRSKINPEHVVGKRNHDLPIENIELNAALEEIKLKNKLLSLRNQNLSKRTLICAVDARVQRIFSAQKYIDETAKLLR